MSGATFQPEALAAGAEAALARWQGAPEVQQGSLFGADPAEPDGIGELAPAPRGRGRPPGSRNKSTEDWSRFLLTRYRSPLIGLAEIAQATPAALQQELGGAPDSEGKGGVTLPECLRIIMSAQQALAPYLHQKQPTALDAGGAGLFTLVIEGGGGSDGGEGVRIIPHEETEEKQAVSAPLAARSDGEGRTE